MIAITTHMNRTKLHSAALLLSGIFLPTLLLAQQTTACDSHMSCWVTPQPYGSLDTPSNGSTVNGAINVTGWAFSANTVAAIHVYREPNPGEASVPVLIHLDNSDSNTMIENLVYLGDAVLVPGARPDIPVIHPGYPNNDWGWGMQVLTNMLPSNNGSAGTGNGIYKIHAIACEPAPFSHCTELINVATITVNNAASALPFGTLDTPTQGGSAYGAAYANFGWVLTPQPNIIPVDGSTIDVVFNNYNTMTLHPTYNQFRSDIATLFPGLRNSNGAVGAYVFDTTQLPSGYNAIAWGVTDSGGNVQGIGSRAFYVAPAGSTPLPATFITCVQTDNQVCSLSSGTYFIDHTLYITGNNVAIVGAGRTATTLIRAGTVVTRMIEVDGQNLSISNLSINGNKSLWSLLPYGGLNDLGVQKTSDLYLLSNSVSLSGVGFSDSSFFAVATQTGSNLNISASYLSNGMNCGVFGNPTGLNISGTYFENYVGSGICLSGATGTIAYNTFYHNHQGDPTSASIMADCSHPYNNGNNVSPADSYGGGGQIYVTSGGPMTISNNVLNGCNNSLAGCTSYISGTPISGPGAVIDVNHNSCQLDYLVNFGIELDSTQNITLDSNVASNHGASGYWIGGSSQVKVTGATGNNNWDDGLEIYSPGPVSVINSTFQNNYNQFSRDRFADSGVPAWPRWYGIRIDDGMPNNSVCIHSDSATSPFNDSRLQQPPIGHGPLYPGNASAYYYNPASNGCQ